MDPLDLAAQRRRAEELASRVVGLTPEQVRAEAAVQQVDLRLLQPDDLMTADFRPARLNALLDGAGQVARTWLG